MRFKYKYQIAVFLSFCCKMDFIGCMCEAVVTKTCLFIFHADLLDRWEGVVIHLSCPLPRSHLAIDSKTYVIAHGL